MGRPNEVNEIMADVDAIIKKHGITAETLHYALDKIRREEEVADLKEVIKTYEPFLGKCYCELTDDDEMFPPMYKYLKVVNVVRGKERVECLVFYEHPTYWFDYDTFNSSQTLSYKTGKFEFTSVEVEPVDTWYFANPYVKEITPEQYGQAMERYYKELIEMPWYTEHYRFGGVFPSDPKWPRNGGCR